MANSNGAVELCDIEYFCTVTGQVGDTTHTHVCVCPVTGHHMQSCMCPCYDWTPHTQKSLALGVS